MELSREAGIDSGNLSGKVKTLADNGVIAIQKKKVNGRTRSFINLTPETAKLIECVINLKNEKQLPTLTDIKYIDHMLDNLLNENIQILTANHIQRISHTHRIPVESSFYKFIGNKKNIDQLKPVLSIVLLALHGMIRNSDEKSRVIIKDKVLGSITTIRDTLPQERPGIIAQKILNEFHWDFLPVKTLVDRYIRLLQELPEEEFKQVHLLCEQIIQRYPDQKMETRGRLIKLAKESGEFIRERIENEFTRWY
jgi:DNA-binding MarR family transcriptional regulator